MFVDIFDKCENIYKFFGGNVNYLFNFEDELLNSS